MPIMLKDHLGKGGTGFQGTEPGSAAYALKVLASQTSVVVTGGAAEAELTATGIKTTSVIISAVMFDTGVPSNITGNVSGIPEDGKITFDTITTGNTVVVTWGDPV